VIGDGAEISTDELVIGDLLIISYSNKVATDIRVKESKDLEFDMSLLTGESEVVEGTVDCTDDKYVEPKNIDFMTTSFKWSGQGQPIIVFSTGKNTIIGQISGLTDGAKTKKTNLKKRAKYICFNDWLCRIFKMRPIEIYYILSLAVWVCTT
jgi:sodium/potassium-transporting ATPase subunit alpha